MKYDTVPMMKVNTIHIDNGKHKEWELVLSKENLEHISQGFPDVECLIGHTGNGFYFQLFQGGIGEMPKSFKPMQDGYGYFANIGMPQVEIPSWLLSADQYTEKSKREWKRLSDLRKKGLEHAIQNLGKIPIVHEGLLTNPYTRKKIDFTLGNVVLRIEKEDSKINNPVPVAS